MPMFLTAQGRPTTANQPDRLLWYSVKCSYWTDDFDKLTKMGPGIPCCPHCKSPGFQDEAGRWLDGAKKFDEKEPGYSDFLNRMKEKCQTASIAKLWELEKALIAAAAAQLSPDA